MPMPELFLSRAIRGLWVVVFPSALSIGQQ
jgi:hypothetical protein